MLDQGGGKIRAAAPTRSTYVEGHESSHIGHLRVETDATQDGSFCVRTRTHTTHNELSIVDAG